MSRVTFKTVDVTIDTDTGSRELPFLKYTTLDGGRFGKNSRTAFLVDDEPKHSGWGDAVLAAGHATVRTRRRDRFPVAFRVASADEMVQALANINKVRPIYGTKTAPENLRVIIMEMEPV